jgi:hypothetical protein
LINEGEVNILKKAGLTEILFDIRIPQTKYPFAVYSSGFKGADYYLNKLETLKTSSQPFQFICSRFSPSGEMLFDSNIKVSLEDYNVNEDSKNGFDITVDVALKQYKSYGTKVVEIKPPTPVQPTVTATVEPQRPAESAPKARTYTVVKGDCLWAIAQRFLNNGNRYPEIYSLNQALIDGHNVFLWLCVQ